MDENFEKQEVSVIDCCDDNYCSSSGSFNSLDLLIEGYLVVTRDRFKESITGMTSFKEYVYGTHARGVDGEVVIKRHPHQRRIPTEVLDTCTKNLKEAFKDVSPSFFADFEQLFSFVEANKNSTGFEQVCIYDTALRYAGSNHCPLPQRYVYLHRGALWGAQSLWLIDQLFKNKQSKRHKPFFRHPEYPLCDCVVLRSEFSKEFDKMSSAEIEDFLCVCHAILKGMYLKMAADM